MVADQRIAEFVTAYGRLIAAYRAAASPSSAPALLDELVRLAVAGPVSVEAGIIRSGEYDTANLRSHLIRRQIESLTLAAGITAETLEKLARALGGEAPLPEHPSVSYEMVAQLVPDRPKAYVPKIQPAGSNPLVLMGAQDYVEEDDRGASGFAAEVAALTDAVTAAARRGSWIETLHAAQALVRLSSRVPDPDRGGVSIAARRVLSRPVLAGIIELAIRTTEEQARAAEVLQWRGAEAAELMIDSIRKTQSPEPHRFLLEALSRMPDAVPLLLPLLRSSEWREVRHAVEVLGRQMAPDALRPLRGLLTHPEARVRGATLDALSRYPAASGSESLRQGLAHASPETRRDAAGAIGRRGGSALAMPLLAALEVERDAATWRTMLVALSRIEAPEAAAAMATVALRKRGLLSRGGFSLAQRLDVVAVLAASPTRAARQALSKVAREAGGEVGAAARGELERRPAPTNGHG